MLPHLAQHVAAYDDQTHQLHAYTTGGTTCTFETPAELIAAIHAQQVYAPYHTALWGMLLAAQHGVDLVAYAKAVSLPVQPWPDTNAQLRAWIVRHVQRVDRAHEKSVRLALELVSDDDTITIIDAEGLFAALLQRIMQRESTYPAVPTHSVRTAPADPASTLVLWCSTINDAGVLEQASVHDQLVALRDNGVLAYVIAPQGPTPSTTEQASLCPTAVITSRGIYRADRLMRYHQDTDLGSDLISLH